jgi:hypothetical protein
VGVRDDNGLAAPSRADLVGRAAGQRDERVGGGDQDVELPVVGAPVRVVRVAQVVHGEDEGLRPPSQRRDQLLEVGHAAGVEAEVQVEDVELVGLDPRRVEHHRGPPLLGRRGPGGRGVGQPPGP